MMSEPGWGGSYEQVLQEVDFYLRPPVDALTFLDQMVSLLARAFDHYSFIAIYVREGDELVLRAWRGMDLGDRPRIKLGEGLVGYSAKAGRGVTFTDIDRAPRNTARYRRGRLELAVPVTEGESVYGSINVDSRLLGATREADRRFLEQLAMKVLPAVKALSQAAAATP